MGQELVIGSIGRLSDKFGARPGDKLTVARITFTWTGGAKFLAFGWAIKPDVSGYNNGEYLIGDMTGGYPGSSWAWTTFSVPAGNNTPTQLLGGGALSVPVIGTQLSRTGQSVKINSGIFDCWLWISDWDALIAEFPNDAAAHIGDERFMLTPNNQPVVDKDVAWIETTSAQQLSGLDAYYQK